MRASIPKRATKSNSQMKMPTTRTHAATIKVFFSTCCGVGQTTFFSSLRSSRKYLQMAPQVLLNQFSFLTSAIGAASLLGLVVNGVLSAESAVLLHFETVRVVLLVLHGVVVSLLALGASQSDFNAHNGTSLKIASLYHFG